MSKQELAEMLGMWYHGKDSTYYYFKVGYKEIMIMAHTTLKEAWDIAADRLFDKVLECVVEK